VLLNAAAHFAGVLSSCRSTVLASGTLAPVIGRTRLHTSSVIHLLK
jgi:hypothetical protein